MTEQLHGNVKLIGVQGFVKDEEFTVKEGEEIVIGRSRSCDISLRSLLKYLEVDPTGEKVDEHFRTVSRKHLRITYKSPDELILEDLSSNGSFLDGARMPKKIVLNDIMKKDHIITLGSKETLQISWKQLIKRKKMKVVEVAEGETPPPNARLYEDKEQSANAQNNPAVVPAPKPIEKLDALPPSKVSEPLLDDDSIPEIDPNRTEVAPVKQELEEMKTAEKQAKEQAKTEEAAKPKHRHIRGKRAGTKRGKRGRAPLKPPTKTAKPPQKKSPKPIAKSVSEQVIKSYKAGKSKGPAAAPDEPTEDKPKHKKGVSSKPRRINRRLQRGR